MICHCVVLLVITPYALVRSYGDVSETNWRGIYNSYSHGVLVGLSICLVVCKTRTLSTVEVAKSNKPSLHASGWFLVVGSPSIDLGGKSSGSSVQLRKPIEKAKKHIFHSQVWLLV